MKDFFRFCNILIAARVCIIDSEEVRRTTSLVSSVR